MPTMTPQRRRAATAIPVGVLLLMALVVGSSMRLSGCQSDAPLHASASKVASRSQLIGGPGALGEVGDYLLENDKIRIIIQDKGFSRGFGVYGGSLIDADLVRPVAAGGSDGGNGRDQFGELFPLFFLEAMVPDSVEVVSDGADGGPASVRVSGTGGDFLTLVKVLNQLFLNSHDLSMANPLDPESLKGEPTMRFETLYELAPGKRYVKITNSLINTTDGPLTIPSASADTLLTLFLGGGIDLDVPLGTVLLFGAGNNAFAPGAGYDIRFALEENYARGKELDFPALPGLLANVMATSNRNGVSYGFMSAGDTPGFVANRQKCTCPLATPEDCTEPSMLECGNAYEAAYPDVKGRIGDETMLVPFIASAFTGALFAQAPNELGPGEKFSYTTYFIVGDGDVASVMNEVYGLRGESAEVVEGIVRDELTLDPVSGASMVVYDAGGRPINQLFSDATGRFKGKLPAGQYTVRVEQDPVLGSPVPFTVVSGKASFLELGRPSMGRVHVRVREASGRDLPAKVTVVGTEKPSAAGMATHEYLFDLAAGQRWRVSDFVPDKLNDPDTLQFIEASGYTRGGEVTLTVRPDRVYTVYVSRGIEYDVQSATVRVDPGTTSQISTILTRVVNTEGYISGDFHLHAAPSLDSDLNLDERVVSCAGEGLEYIVATDHNFVTDYRPTIERAGLTEWMTSMIGLELTTLESGHFNGFPVKRDLGAITRGSFEWSLKPPAEVLGTLRGLGKYGPENTIVQINHPRDSILGYFDQYNLDAFTAEPKPLGGVGFDPSSAVAVNGPAFRDPETGENLFSFDFDAMEIVNGKRFEQFRSFRSPRDYPNLSLEAGQIVCDDGEVAFPGMVDDWFNMLNKGMRLAGVGNSDSHHTEGEEPGFPRTYFWAGTDDPAFVDDLTVVKAFHDQRLIVTNGPFAELFVNDQPVGSKVDDPDGQVNIHVKIQAPEWIGVNQALLWANGELVHTWDVTMDGTVWEGDTQLLILQDTWYVLEVKGNRSLFPVVSPLELPPILLTDAVGALAGAFGLTSAVDDIGPSLTHIVTAYAITNPVYVNVAEAEFVPSGPVKLECARNAFGATPIVENSKPTAWTDEELRRIERKRNNVPSIWFPRQKGDLYDVRVIFEQFGKHGH